MRKTPAVLIAVAALGGAGAYAAVRDAGDGGLAKALAGYVDTGRHSVCVPSLYPTLDTKVYGRTILYRARAGGPIYRTDTSGGCESAMRGDALISRQYQGRACSGDIVQTFDTVSRFPTGSCALGEFTTYEKPKPR